MIDGDQTKHAHQDSGARLGEALTAYVGINKMLFPIVLFILPVLFVITLAPGLLSVLGNLQQLGGAR